jgi:tRNA(fMet)-specific endonuclease VapC
MKGEAALAERLRGFHPEQIVVNSVVRAELMFGVHNSQRVQHNLIQLHRFLEPFPSASFDDQAADRYGSTRAVLKYLGHPVGHAGLLIASIAMAHDHVLVTRNWREFFQIPGLRVESWD